MRERVALVTGASRGIGRAIAVQLARRGARVMATARDEAQLRRLADEAGVAYVVGAVDTPAGCAEIVAATTERLGPVEILVNNAGAMGELAPVWELDSAAWRATLALNLDAPFELTRLVAGSMVERGCGRIVMVSSTAGNVGLADFSAYCAAKAGLLGLMRAVAQDVGAHGVTCNAVCPGAVHTQIADEWLDLMEAQGHSREETYAEAAAKYPPKRLLTPEEIAATVAFLAGEEASGINGETITVALGGYR